MRLTLALAVTEYLRARTDMTRQSRRNTGYTLAQFASTVGDGLDIRSVRQAHVVRWLASRHDAAAPSTVRRELSTVRTFFHWLQILGRIKRDPTVGVPRVRVPRGDPRELDPDAVTKGLLAAPDERGRLIYLLMVGGGLRRMEVAGLEVGDVNLTARTVYIARGKGGHSRTVVLTEEMSEAYRAYIAAHPAASGPLIRSFTRPRSPVTAPYVGRLVIDYLRAAGVKSHPHDGVSGHALRHTFAGELLDSGADPRDVQEVMGHDDMSTTSRYWQRRQNLERLHSLERRSYNP